MLSCVLRLLLHVSLNTDVALKAYSVNWSPIPKAIFRCLNNPDDFRIDDEGRSGLVTMLVNCEDSNPLWRYRDRPFIRTIVGIFLTTLKMDHLGQRRENIYVLNRCPLLTYQHHNFISHNG